MRRSLGRGHAHSDDERLYAVHEHPGGAEPHEHEWDGD